MISQSIYNTSKSYGSLHTPCISESNVWYEFNCTFSPIFNLYMQTVSIILLNL